ncbi:MAG: WecB/TagA/CpsF family glycosyltransferase [Bacteroidota bacterium]|jgi:N-acetylglucosaminyldiphosphoundecaprenol N-acetyl-beta-D-mannosaminyltransferase
MAFNLYTVDILDIPIFNGDEDELVDHVIQTANYKTPRCISASGAHGLVISKENHFFKRILKNFYLNIPDGMPLVWIGKLKGAKRIKRCYGPDVFKNLITQSKDKKIKHFFCGGKKGIAEKLKNACEEQFKNFNICGTYSPPFYDLTDTEIKELANVINSNSPDVVWIGLGTPKQEIFAHRISKYLSCGYIITVGAAFDFHTGTVQQAPEYIQKIGMEWFFRLLMEPKRLWKRYLNIIPKFLTYSLLDLIVSLRNRKK